MENNGQIKTKQTDILSYKNLLPHIFIGLLCSLFVFGCTQEAERSQWQPVEGRLKTRWTQELSPDSVHPEYPRPQLRRKDWLNLNGLWDYAIQSGESGLPESFEGEILVPFPVESALSGVGRPVQKDKRLWYRRRFEIPRKWKGQRVLLNFCAVDWETTVWVNGSEVGVHRGGYDPFTFDITDFLTKSNEQEILLAVWDPADEGVQPRGKQVMNPRDIWYTAVTGIWQTVWLEPVSSAYIRALRVVPDLDAKKAAILSYCSEKAFGHHVLIEAIAGKKIVARGEGAPGEEIVLSIDEPKLWSPDSPFLYDLDVILENPDGRRVDGIHSYFGMRRVSLGEDSAGVTRIFLNDEPVFMFGPLDQGWWPDGLYASPTDEALRYDLEVTKRLGYNMLRKHVKVEPERFYYWCDKLGVLVWQDMPNGDSHIGRESPDIERTEESAQQFKLELKNVMDALYNHPSIVMWVPFNEGWGQFETEYIVGWIKGYDPTRLVDNASGWADRSVGDVHDIHSYPGPDAPPNEEDRAAVLGEFGGLGLPVAGHTWQDEENWGYRSFQTGEELTVAYLELIEKLKGLVKLGLSAAIYTQTTDVEIEVNGLMTYDREMIKMDVERVAGASRELYPIVKDK